MIDDAFLTTDEVLEYRQVNLRTVDRLIKAGKIPAVRAGRRVSGLSVIRDARRLRADIPVMIVTGSSTEARGEIAR